jgi:inosine/xanthosine triphosphate pyrophosphatase family protein
MKTVIEMAREAGWLEEVGNELPCTGSMNLERFANLVRADEREACAKVLDEMAEDMEREMEPSTAIAYVRSKAATIRARGETK